MAVMKKSEIMAVNVQIAKLLSEGKTSEALALVNSQNEKLASAKAGKKGSKYFSAIADDVMEGMKKLGLQDGLYIIEGGKAMVAPLHNEKGYKLELAGYRKPRVEKTEGKAEVKTEGKAEVKTEGKAEVKTEGKAEGNKGKGKH